jgi:hypothetical protein
LGKTFRNLFLREVGLRKEIVNMESNVKVLQKELEGSTPSEHLFTQASAKVETLEAEFKLCCVKN